MLSPEFVAFGLCLLLVVIVLHHLGFIDKKENYLAAPTVRASLVDVDRARQYDKKGLTVTDYVLESKMLNDMPVSNKVRILG